MRVQLLLYNHAIAFVPDHMYNKKEGIHDTNWPHL